MGIRLALGATRPQLLAMVLRQGMRHVLLGLAVGVVATIWVRQLVDPWLFQTRTGEPSVIAGAAVLFGAVAAVASWLPARRASNVDPLTLLRQD
jgi:ABC-type antimicrobial peptide transport system permease subunit